MRRFEMDTCIINHVLRTLSICACNCQLLATITDVARRTAKSPTEMPDWTFLTNHAHVLLCITQNPQIRLAEVARLVGIGERAVHSITSDLVEAGYVVRRKRGRNNVYAVNLNRPLRHPLESDYKIAEVFKPFTRNRGTR
jgi:hypothetical protein